MKLYNILDFRPQSIGIINRKFYMSVFHTPNTFKIMQKGYYYVFVKNL